MPLKILSKKEIQRRTAKVIEYKTDLPIPYLSNFSSIGIDPGSRNIGVTVIHPNIPYLIAYKINMEKFDDPVERMLEISKTVNETIAYYGYNPKLCIEGASYEDRFGQVELAEARASMVWGLLDMCTEIKIVPPKKIRSVVLGDGNLKTKWKGVLEGKPHSIPHDVMASLNCAYYFTVQNQETQSNQTKHH